MLARGKRAAGWWVLSVIRFPECRIAPSSSTHPFVQPVYFVTSAEEVGSRGYGRAAPDCNPSLSTGLPCDVECFLHRGCCSLSDLFAHCTPPSHSQPQPTLSPRCSCPPDSASTALAPSPKLADARPSARLVRTSSQIPMGGWL